MDDREPELGIGVDRFGGPVADPTKNVERLVEAEGRRQDDLRRAELLRISKAQQAESEHVREVVQLRAEYDTQLRVAESARINAIREVDVAAVNRAAEVASTQAATLAATVVQSAEALRTQVETTRTGTQTALAAALGPIIKDVAELRKVQYETAGGKAQTVETREVHAGGTSDRGLWVAIVAAVVSLIAVGIIVISAIKSEPVTERTHTVTVQTPTTTAP